MLDKNFIQRKIKLIQEELSKLESLSHYSFKEISDDFTKMYTVERALEKINLVFFLKRSLSFFSLVNYFSFYHGKLNL